MFGVNCYIVNIFGLLVICEFGFVLLVIFVVGCLGLVIIV